MKPPNSHVMARALRHGRAIGARITANHQAAARTAARPPADVHRYLLREAWTWDTLMNPPAEPSPEQRMLLRWWQGDMADRGELICDTLAGIDWHARRAQLAPAHAAAWWAFIHRRAAHAHRKRHPDD